jgi:hypothetical protein
MDLEERREVFRTADKGKEHAEIHLYVQHQFGNRAIQGNIIGKIRSVANRILP